MTLLQLGTELLSLLAQYQDTLSRAFGFLAGAGLMLAVGWLLVLPAVGRVIRRRNRNNPTIESATETYVRIVVIVVAAVAGVVGAGYGGVVLDSALVIAALTLVVGVAGQEVIGSLVSGLFLVADPDFNVGDWVAWPGGEGIVEAVDFRVTRIRTVNFETVTVPNTELTGNAITRPYGRERYRVTERVDVAYSDDVERALMELAEVARADDRVLEEPAPTSRIVELTTGTVGIQAEFWVADPMDVGLVDVRSSFRRRVKARFDEEGLTLGPPSGREVSGSLAVELDGEPASP